MWQPIAWQVAPIFDNKSGPSFSLRRGPAARDQLSLIIPNAPTQGPPTSRAVLVNLGKSIGPAVHGFPLLTELEARLYPIPSLANPNLSVNHIVRQAALVGNSGPAYR